VLFGTRCVAVLLRWARKGCLLQVLAQLAYASRAATHVHSEQCTAAHTNRIQHLLRLAQPMQH
jgi:hypothetical protein